VFANLRIIGETTKNFVVFLWFFARLFVTFSQAKKLLSLERTKKITFFFGSLLVYS